jgi:hypothetical protein
MNRVAASTRFSESDGCDCGLTLCERQEMIAFVDDVTIRAAQTIVRLG